MNTALYIAKRYLFAKKSTNAINIISAISAAGVFVSSAALIIILSVFNGFGEMALKMFNTITPQILVVAAKGKTFNPNTAFFNRLRKDDRVFAFTEALTENVLVRYTEKQSPALIKGVSEDFVKNKGLDTIVIEGSFLLQNKRGANAVVGLALQQYLGINPNDVFEQLQIFSPKKGAKGTGLNPLDDFNVLNIPVAGVFQVQHDFGNMILTPLFFARELLAEKQNVSSIEINLKKNVDVEAFKKNLAQKLGINYLVKNRVEQNQALYHVLETEKWMVYIILTFILIIAVFNIVGSLTMLVIDKQKDISVLNSLGAGKPLIKKIFLLEGMMITLTGCIFGIITGFIFCYLQQQFGWIKMGGAALLFTDAYPIAFKWTDFVLVFVTVAFFSFFASVLAAGLSIKQLHQFNKDL